MALVGSVGCGKTTYPVQGQVIYASDGKPVPAGVGIWFESTTPPYDRSSAILQADGKFILSTDREGNGAIRGEHRIRFDPPQPVTDKDAETALAKIMHPKYIEFRTSGLKEAIQPGTNAFVIKVERSKKP